MTKFDAQHLLITLAQGIRKKVYPYLGQPVAREVHGTAYSGDATFQIDVIAENEVENYLSGIESNIAYYTEDRGLVKPNAAPEWLLIIDPIDGTRPAFSGFESAVVSIALCPFRENPIFKDMTHAVILELKTGNLFYAQAGAGVLLQSSDPFLSIMPSGTDKLEPLRWCFDIVGRPVQQIFNDLGALIDQSSYQGGVYIFNCSAFAITRIVTGQLDAYIDTSGRTAGDAKHNIHNLQIPSQQPTMGLFAYDIAAAYLIAQEAECLITDSYGKSLETASLVDKQILSCIAASNLKLHQKLVAWLNR